MVAMKPLVEGMGLDWGGQHKKLLGHPVLGQGVSVMPIPSAGGVQKVTLLKLPLVNFWLATIDTTRVKGAEARERILVYQREAADVLFRHFFGKAERTVRGDAHAEAPDLDRLRMVSEVRRIYGEAAARAMWDRLGLPKVPEMATGTRGDPGTARLALARLSAMQVPVRDQGLVDLSEVVARAANLDRDAVMALRDQSAMCRGRDELLIAEASPLLLDGLAQQLLGLPGVKRVAGVVLHYQGRPMRCICIPAGEVMCPDDEA